jgi:hypothetical protein
VQSPDEMSKSYTSLNKRRSIESTENPKSRPINIQEMMTRTNRQSNANAVGIGHIN